MIAALRYGSFELGVATIVGSTVFNVLVIPGASILAHSGAMASGRELVYRRRSST